MDKRGETEHANRLRVTLVTAKTQTAVGCAPTRARESLAKKEKTMSNEGGRKSKFPKKEGRR